MPRKRAATYHIHPCMTSETISGRWSRAPLSPALRLSIDCEIASRTSPSVITTSRGKPVTGLDLLPKTQAVHLLGSPSRSPDLDLLRRLFANQNFEFAADVANDVIVEFVACNLQGLRAHDTPSEITAMSLVPPPMSMIVLPTRSFTGRRIPISRAIGSSTIYTSRAAVLGSVAHGHVSTLVMPYGTPPPHAGRAFFDC